MRTDLNGRKVRVVRWVEGRGRWMVKVVVTGEMVNVREQNLVGVEEGGGGGGSGEDSDSDDDEDDDERAREVIGDENDDYDDDEAE